MLIKVIYPKYFKHWLSIVAHTIDCMCSKILSHGLNHGLSFSLFKFFGWKNILNFQSNLEFFFRPRNLKIENDNPWFNPWFNILPHTQSIVCATIDSPCLEYLEYITFNVCLIHYQASTPGGISNKWNLLFETTNNRFCEKI